MRRPINADTKRYTYSDNSCKTSVNAGKWGTSDNTSIESYAYMNLFHPSNTITNDNHTLTAAKLQNPMNTKRIVTADVTTDYIDCNNESWYWMMTNAPIMYTCMKSKMKTQIIHWWQSIPVLNNCIINVLSSSWGSICRILCARHVIYPYYNSYAIRHMHVACFMTD